MRLKGLLKHNIKAKGCNPHFKKSYLSFDKYKNVHENLKIYRFPAIGSRGFDHELYTVFQNEIVLSTFDSKMYISDYNVHTFFKDHVILIINA